MHWWELSTRWRQISLKSHQSHALWRLYRYAPLLHHLISWSPVTLALLKLRSWLCFAFEFFVYFCVKFSKFKFKGKNGDVMTAKHSWLGIHFCISWRAETVNPQIPSTDVILMFFTSLKCRTGQSLCFNLWSKIKHLKIKRSEKHFLLFCITPTLNSELRNYLKHDMS